MGSLMDTIGAEAAEISGQFEADCAARARTAGAVAEARAKHATPIPAGLGPLLEKAGLTEDDLQQYYDAQTARAEELSDALAQQLVLTEGEIEQLEESRRKMLLALSQGPFGLQPAGDSIIYLATSCSAYVLPASAPGCSCECTPGHARNTTRLRLRVTGHPTVTIQAGAASSCLFYVPARLNPAPVHVQVRTAVHGYGFGSPGPLGSAWAWLYIEVSGMQHGQTLGQHERTIWPASSTDWAGRWDQYELLGFDMPALAMPIWIEVCVTGVVSATGAGAFAQLDFGSGKDNHIDAICVRATDVWGGG